MPHTHIPDLPWNELRSPAGRFHSFCRDVSLALGGTRNTGTWGGGHPFDVQFRRVPAGAAICPYHLHLVQWEFFIVTAGQAVVRVGGETHRVAAGAAFVHPPGEPHQLSNPGPDALEVMIVADNPMLDACHYPDSNKWALRPPGMVFRANPAEYFDGEEPPSDQSGTFRPPVTPLAAPATPFVDRIRRIDDLPWEEWTSPRGQFRGTSKELSIALGARRNTPTGLGGHPFEVEYSRLAPGETGCPFHFHAAQWELFLIVSGQAKIRAGDATLQAGPGDVWLHPPGEPHQIINASATEDLLFYLIADNPPADYWHYPDSQKWGLRQPRMFFRPVEVDYYDGEESPAGGAPV